MDSGKLRRQRSFTAIVYGTGLFVATESTGNLYISPDGLYWTKRTSKDSGAYDRASSSAAAVSSD
ncbi:MAG: hypothetical protein LBB27_01430 [Tannerellaceae bacterium]|nr:hypothetical protein [Tannerellaceae bacterium]